MSEDTRHTHCSTGRHRFARGPVTEEVKQKLIAWIRAAQSDNVELLAEDIIEVIAAARNEQGGFRAALHEIERLAAFDAESA